MTTTATPEIFKKRSHQTGHAGAPRDRLSATQHTEITLGRARRMALIVTPRGDGSARDQAKEAVATIDAALRGQSVSMTVTMQTLFVRSADDIPLIRGLMEAYYGGQMPATTYIAQPPCDGKALAIEAWAVGGEGVGVEFPAEGTVGVEYDGLRWIYVSGIAASEVAENAADKTRRVFEELTRRLELAGAAFSDVTRVWLYQEGITALEKDSQGGELERYRELNRSRTDFFEDLERAGKMTLTSEGAVCYPASTGIGMEDGGLKISCTAVRSARDDVRLVSLENPNQTAAFDYARHFSAKSPKFARAMAMVTNDYATIWVSGTASIIDSESIHLGDIEKQTEQTIDNIEALMGPENCDRHGIAGAGARLDDLARVRVYVKRKEDFEVCRAVCERRFGDVPALYVLADVCRPELLVEIEGVAFSRRIKDLGDSD